MFLCVSGVPFFLQAARSFLPKLQQVWKVGSPRTTLLRGSVPNLGRIKIIMEQKVKPRGKKTFHLLLWLNCGKKN